MPFLYKDYTDLILKTYAEQLDAGNLPRLLMRPTRANIKQECLHAYTERLKRGENVEANTLRAFFGVLTDERQFNDLINDCPLDKFRPLQNLMNGRVQNPDAVTVELLAWLMDFKPRPFNHAQQVLKESSIDSNSDSKTGSSQSSGEIEMKALLSVTNIVELKDQLEEGGEKTPKAGNEVTTNPPRKPKLKIIVEICLITIIFFGGMYTIRQYEISRGKVFGKGNTHCMYWAEDHFEGMSCTEEKKDRLKLPMDSARMKSFKKITRTDTITEQSIGKVHYLKTNKVLEYFTTGGNHPIYVNRPLRPLSQYIYDTYLAKDTASNK